MSLAVVTLLFMQKKSNLNKHVFRLAGVKKAYAFVCFWAVTSSFSRKFIEEPSMEKTTG
jgi:hypothetical protein